MGIKEIIKTQQLFDKQHGWSLVNDSNKEKLKLINKDLIGIMGEIGEFSNLIKRLNLLAESDW